MAKCVKWQQPPRSGAAEQPGAKLTQGRLAACQRCGRPAHEHSHRPKDRSGRVTLPVALTR